MSALSVTVLIVGCSSQRDPLAMSLPNPTVIYTDVPSSTPTVTFTATPTVTPTITATPTQTSIPTPTPRGYYRHAKMGFVFQPPSSWRIDEESDSIVVFQDRYRWFYLMAFSFWGDEERTIDDFAQEIAQSFFNTTIHSSRRDEVSLANGVKAPRVSMTLNTPFGYIAAQVIYTRLGHRGYAFVVYHNPNPQEVSQEKLEKFFNTVELYIPEFYGLDKSQTLVQLSNDPYAVNLDPATTAEGAGGLVGLLFSGLVRLSPQMEIVPDLVESWEISPDGLTYTFTLRPDIKFLSGDPITAQDFKNSWERAVDPKTGSDTARTYLGDIVGVEEKLQGKADQISGVVALDARRLQVTQDGPKPYFLAKLTHPVAFVVDARQPLNPGRKDWRLNPNVSGAYKIREYHKAEGIVFEQNPNYYAAAPVPYLVYLFYPTSASETLYSDDILDIAVLPSIDAAQVRRIDNPNHVDWHTVAMFCTNMIQFDNTQPPFDDVYVRKAFSLAVDKSGIVERLTENLDLPAASILPPGMPGYSGEFADQSYNIIAARKAIESSRYAIDLPPVVLNAAGFADSNRDDVSNLVDAWRKNLGVDVRVEYLDAAQFTEAARQQHGQMVLYSWCADYPDPQNFLDILFYSGGDFNVSGYSNSQIDVLLEQARIELEPNARLALYQEIEKLLLADYAAIPLSHPVIDALVRPNVKGFILSPIQTMFLPWMTLGDIDK